MKIYNTLTRKKEELIPQVDGKIKMFVCGPTVYDYIHVGNARTFVIFDVVAKYLRHSGFEVDYLQNITDIEDKIIDRAKETGVDPANLAKDFENKFYEDMKQLGVDSVTRYAPGSEHIEQVVTQVKTLIEKGHAYLIDGDGYYFDLKTFPEYGKLSGRTVEMAEDGVSRIDENDKKRNRGDFCLWKLSKPGEPSWDTELGRGRPGWHIEDTAITEHYFGLQYDLHGGGQDLMFPHHEAEIAQQESASGLKPFVKYWMHAGFLINKDSKMSKSLGNFTTLHDALKEYSSETLRFYFLSGHYRSPLDYGKERLKSAEAATQRLGEFRQKLKTIIDGKSHKADSARNEDIKKQLSHIESSWKTFRDAMENDFNTPEAVSVIFELIKNLNPQIDSGKVNNAAAQKALDFLISANDILGIIPTSQEAVPHKIQTVVQLREQLRQDKDFKGADKLRTQIEDAGYQVDDTVYGSLVKKK